MNDTNTAVIEPNPFPEDMLELTEVARRLLNHSADCMHADGRPVTAQELRKLAEALYNAARAKDTVPPEIHTNTGHGHVFPRADGVKARCGGPGVCVYCSIDAARAKEGKA